MPFDKFLLAVESHALSQADKGIIKGPLAKFMFFQFYHSKICKIEK